MIPEFVGRIPVVASLEALDRDMLVRIITEPKNALVKQYKELFRMDGVELEFEAKALQAVAERAYQRKTGARGEIHSGRAFWIPCSTFPQKTGLRPAL